MTNPTTHWPCPVCAELLSSALEDCPNCRLPGAWVDLLLALGFSVRQFHYWSILSALSKPQYRALLEAIRQRQEAWTRAAQAEQPLPHTGLPSRGTCWRCQNTVSPTARLCAACGAPLATPEVRLFRYQTFLCQEIRDHAQAGRLTAEQAEQFLGEIGNSLADVTARLQGTGRQA
jgi:hypothetical protein